MSNIFQLIVKSLYVLEKRNQRNVRWKFFFLCQKIQLSSQGFFGNTEKSWDSRNLSLQFAFNNYWTLQLFLYLRPKYFSFNYRSQKRLRNIRHTTEANPTFNFASRYKSDRNKIPDYFLPRWDEREATERFVFLPSIIPCWKLWEKASEFSGRIRENNWITSEANTTTASNFLSYRPKCTAIICMCHLQLFRQDER